MDSSEASWQFFYAELGEWEFAFHEGQFCPNDHWTMYCMGGEL